MTSVRVVAIVATVVLFVACTDETDEDDDAGVDDVSVVDTSAPTDATTTADDTTDATSKSCPETQVLNPLDNTCQPAPDGDSPIYEAKTLIDYGAQGALQGPGENALLPSTSYPVPRPSDNALYVFAANRLYRYDLGTGLHQAVAGLGVAGCADGPLEAAQFNVNTYQNAGFGFSPDGERFYLVGECGVRVVDLNKGEVSTLAADKLDGVRALHVGRESGNVYLTTWNEYFVATPSGKVEKRTWKSPRKVLGTKNASPPGFIAVDEKNGYVYGLERNYGGGALYRWPVEGGPVEWLNTEATKRDRNEQYTSDGPVSGLAMANPSGLTIGPEGFLHIGAGDGRTFRRFNPETGMVRSLCHRKDGRYEWCADNVVAGVKRKRNVFHTWPNSLYFDAVGNGYFSFSVWPRTVVLRRTSMKGG